MRHFTKIFLLILFTSIFTYPCTTGIITGKRTIDGRPILFKHRDSDFEQNKLMYFSDGKYNYIGLVNSSDRDGKEVWGGSNSVGFAIINSASYNLKDVNDETKLADLEGMLMKKALQNCATVDEFEKLLNELPKPLGVEANFGVIDAFGNAAYFECNNFTYKKFDANNPETAPNGYLIRTNFSVSGRVDEGYGYIRYANADELIRTSANSKDLSFQFILQNVSRSLKHSLTKTDLSANPLPDESESKFVAFEDFIPRNSSTSTILIHGVKAGENPELTTIWTLLGFPLATVAIPTWVEAGKNLPQAVISNENGVAPLCDKSLKLKAKIFPIKRGSGYKYINLPALINKEGSGILQKIIPIENEIIQKASSIIELWREEKHINKEEAEKFYKWADKKVNQAYKNLFNI